MLHLCRYFAVVVLWALLDPFCSLSATSFLIFRLPVSQSNNNIYLKELTFPKGKKKMKIFLEWQCRCNLNDKKGGVSKETFSSPHPINLFPHTSRPGQFDESNYIMWDHYYGDEMGRINIKNNWELLDNAKSHENNWHFFLDLVMFISNFCFRIILRCHIEWNTNSETNISFIFSRPPL